MSLYQIETNIPVPSVNKTNAKWTSLINRMRVGDSVVVRGKSRKSSLSQSLRRQGYKSITRNINPETDEFRVWKGDKLD